MRERREGGTGMPTTAIAPSLVKGTIKITLARSSSGQALHKLAKTDSASQSSKKGGGLLNPWPGYNFTGRLRPAAQVCLIVILKVLPLDPGFLLEFKESCS